MFPAPRELDRYLYTEINLYRDVASYKFSSPLEVDRYLYGELYDDS